MIELNSNGDEFRDLALLERIEANPDVSQANLAEDLGVAIGTINWHLKRLVEKGFVKVKRARRRKLRYIITPAGLALRAKLTLAYIQQSFQLFRQVRAQAQTLLTQLEEKGARKVRLIGNGDIADVCRLTCLEQHIMLTEDPSAPVLVVDGLHVRLSFNDQNESITD